MPFWKKKKPIEVLDAARTDQVNPKAERITSFDTLVQPSEGGSGIPYTDESLRREEGRWGLFVLEDQHDDDPDAIDIVALHGLNGHWEYTWTTRNARGEEVLWLRDLLPLQVPHARVMSFGYDSVLQFSKSVAHIGTFADQLLESLMSRRTGGSSKRPIIFVCHSLGGIVVKKVESRLLINFLHHSTTDTNPAPDIQAIIRAHEKDRYNDLLHSTRGIVFFGTPHRGSSLASWGTLLSNVASLATLGTSTNWRLPKDLETQSAVLRDISKSFVDRAKNLQLISFYETDKMDFLKCEVTNLSHLS